MRGWREPLAALALWWLSACAYLLADSPQARAEAHYVTSGAALALLFAACAWGARSVVARVLWCWAAWEQLQVAACGVGAYGISVPLGSGLCLERYGHGPALVLVAVSILIGKFGGARWQSKTRREM